MIRNDSIRSWTVSWENTGGEALLERAIDPNDPDIPDYIANSNAPTLDNYYRYRILYTRRFAP